MSDLKNFDKNQQKPDLAKHDASILDLAFVMDCTGSMSSYIKNATDVINRASFACFEIKFNFIF